MKIPAVLEHVRRWRERLPARPSSRGGVHRVPDVLPAGSRTAQCFAFGTITLHRWIICREALGHDFGSVRWQATNVSTTRDNITSNGSYKPPVQRVGLWLFYFVLL